MKFKSYYWFLLLVGLVMGIILAVQFRLTREITKDIPSQETAIALSEKLELAREDREKLQFQVDELRVRLDQAVAGPELAMLNEEVDRARGQAGMTEISGPGVEVTLNDSLNVLEPGQDPDLFVLHDEDVLAVLNELKAAGANAIAINGQRIISTTEVRCIGPTILMNKNQRLSPPFVILAHGNPETLANSLKMRNGVVYNLQQFYGIQVDVKKVDEVTIPAYSGALTFEYAKPKELTQERD